MVKQSTKHRYLLTLSEELLARCNRVRALTGNAHWLTDGHHKESLLIGVLKRHLPANVIACRGFVISAVDNTFCSTEQDIVLLDTAANAPLFYEDGVAIAFPHHLIGAISVKSTLTKTTLQDALLGLQSLHSLPDDVLTERHPWTGAFFFSAGKTVSNDPSILRKYLIAFGERHKWSRICALPNLLLVNRNHEAESRFLGYNCCGLSAAYFIGDLLDHIAELRSAGSSPFMKSLDDDTPEQF